MAKPLRLVFLVLAVILLFWFSAHPLWVERIYSTGIYPYLSLAQRKLTGWVPFSVGDVLYVLAGIWLVAGLVRTLRHIFRRDRDPLLWGTALRKFVEGILVLVIVFNVLWGLNYSRLGILYQLKLEPGSYGKDTLQQLIDTLIARVNDTRPAFSGWSDAGKAVVFRGADTAYARAAKVYPFLQHRGLSVKASLFGELDDYMGFQGYYNPFTGEAQLDNSVPRSLIFYTPCHEMAHQLGYASETEANFVGYLAAVHSPDPRFRYSAYLDLFTYADGEMFFTDSLRARENLRRLDTLARADLAEGRRYFRAHRNPIEPYLTRLYGDYLKSQHQPMGLGSYSEVVGWLVAFGEKYGKL